LAGKTLTVNFENKSKYKKKLEKIYNLNYNYKCKAIITRYDCIEQCKLKIKIVHNLQKRCAKTLCIKDVNNNL
jgi:hypothetical protein